MNYNKWLLVTEKIAKRIQKIHKTRKVLDILIKPEINQTDIIFERKDNFIFKYELTFDFKNYDINVKGHKINFVANDKYDYELNKNKIIRVKKAVEYFLFFDKGVKKIILDGRK